jgi:hypothetical protein
MGSIKLAAHLADISGKVGSGVYSRNRGGLYLRNKVIPMNPNTSYQQLARSYMTLASQAWKSLSDAYRTGWEILAVQLKAMNRVGIEYTRNGFSVFVQCYCNAKWMQESVLSIAPPLILGAAINTLVVTADDSMINVIFTPAPGPSDNRMFVYATPNVSQGKNFLHSEYRLIVVLGEGEESDYNVLTQWSARFGGLPVTGSRLNLKVHYINFVSCLPGNVLDATCIVG